MVTPVFSNLTPDDIATAMDLPVPRLFKMCRNIGAYYKDTRETETRPGKIRIIDEPRPWLKMRLRHLHRWIQGSQLFHHAAHGGIRKRSCFTAARRHLGRKAVATRDITDCYPSVTTEQFRQKLLDMGFRSDTARLLSCLLTCRDRIPQGSPTSNDALNIYLYALDVSMTEQCGTTSVYTRNADDHVVSGDNVQHVREISSILEQEIESLDLVVNAEKRDKNGLVLSPDVQLVHSIAVNHPTRTRVSREHGTKFHSDALEYLRSSRAVTAETLPEVARLRSRLAGDINYSKQASISPRKKLMTILKQGDSIVGRALMSANVTRSKKWWVRNRHRDRPAELAALWKRSAGGQGKGVHSVNGSSAASACQVEIPALTGVSGSTISRCLPIE
jgi:hypothetical protein